MRKKNYKEAVNAVEGRKYSAMEKKVLKSRVAGKASGKKILIQEQSFTFVVLKNPKPEASEPLIYLLSTLNEVPGKIAAHYPIRWQIETCFKHLKSNGFNLEEMNLEGEKRSRLMMALVVFAYTLSVCEGMKEYKKVPVKKYKNGLLTKAYSAFRIGLDKLTAFCYNMEAFLAYLMENLVPKLTAFKSKQSIIV